MVDQPHAWIESSVREHEWLAAAHEAFTDAHALWHDAADAYHDPAGFRRTVDALIQATRNVTFRLQASKHEGPASFAQWYEEEGDRSWLTLMKNDPDMIWLKDARTEVTKRKGLSKASFVRVSIIDSYEEPAVSLLKLRADTPTAAVVDRAISRISREHRKHQAVEVVRRWEPESIVDRELLSMIRHCLHVLDGLLAYAAEATEGEVAQGPEEFLSTLETPLCMAVTPDHVPLAFAADSGQPYELALRRKQVTAEQVEAVGKRYRTKPLAEQSPESVLNSLGRSTTCRAEHLGRMDMSSRMPFFGRPTETG